jgi:TRAP-type mannitol/chloroaromatic compound transport system permease small subunit
MRLLLAASNAIDRVLGLIAHYTGLLFLVLVGVICFDVFTRKFSLEVPGFGSTMLQEMEWHIHTVIFALWLGYAYVRNAHVRVDAYTERLGLRTKAWLELLGCLVFALPYCVIVVWYGLGFVEASWRANEVSDATTGLPYRYVIKGVLIAGLALVVIAIVSMILRLCAFLFGPQRLVVPLPFK